VQAFLIEKEKGSPDMVGNRTECALLLLMRSWGIHYKALRDAHMHDVSYVYGFSSDRKMASVLHRRPDGSHRLYCKVCTAYNFDWEHYRPYFHLCVAAQECLEPDCHMEEVWRR
jgi:hypothetical protein